MKHFNIMGAPWYMWKHCTVQYVLLKAHDFHKRGSLVLALLDAY